MNLLALLDAIFNLVDIRCVVDWYTIINIEASSGPSITVQSHKEGESILSALFGGEARILHRYYTPTTNMDLINADKQWSLV